MSQVGRRTKFAFGYLFFGAFAAVLGWHFGVWLGDKVLQLGLWGLVLYSRFEEGDTSVLETWGADLQKALHVDHVDLQEIFSDYQPVYVGVRLLGAVLMATYSFYAGLEAHERYTEIAWLKREHQLTYYSLRHFNPVLFHPATDLVWSITYTVAEKYVGPMGAVVGAVGAFLMLLNQSPIVAVIAGILGFFAGWHVTDMVVLKLFNRFDLTLQIKEAALVIGAMRQLQAEQQAERERKRAEEEQRRFYEQEGGGDLPPGR